MFSLSETVSSHPSHHSQAHTKRPQVCLRKIPIKLYPRAQPSAASAVAATATATTAVAAAASISTCFHLTKYIQLIPEATSLYIRIHETTTTTTTTTITTTTPRWPDQSSRRRCRSCDLICAR